MEKTIKLTGRIDSANAAETEAELVKQIGEEACDLVLDAAELDYISSAGLRVLLRLKKAHNGFKIINCKPEVYDIFDMTGFVEMMEISKAYRELSIDGCEVIGEGANGIVYRTDPDTIVKVYKNHDALEEIHNERELARKAFVMGIPTAIPYDVVKVGDYYGSVFELLNAKSFAKLIISGELTADEAAKESVEILKTMHATMLKEGELPDKKKESMKWAVDAAKNLPEETGSKLIDLFNSVPVTLNMLHGDFHIKNIMRQNNENLLIDMDTLAMGHPIYEIAGVFAAYIGYSCVDKNNAAEFFGITREQADTIWHSTLKYYFEGKDEAFLEEIERKAAIISYARIYRKLCQKSVLEGEKKLQYDFIRNYLAENVPKVDSLAF